MDFGRLALVALAPIALLTFAASALAQDAGTAKAEAIVERYLDLHNRHRLNEVMDLYTPDAVFVLNGGREPVVGRDAIRELERFDVYANSTVQPYGLSYERRGDEWVVHLAGVVEHSDVFAALGIVIVRTEPVREAFTIVGGRIRSVIQPELKSACRQVAGAGFAALTRWLLERRDPRAPDLVPEGKLRLVPGTIPLAISAIIDWRQESGWVPQPEAVRECASP